MSNKMFSLDKHILLPKDLTIFFANLWKEKTEGWEREGRGPRGEEGMKQQRRDRNSRLAHAHALLFEAVHIY